MLIIALLTACLFYLGRRAILSHPEIVANRFHFPRNFGLCRASSDFKTVFIDFAGDLRLYEQVGVRILDHGQRIAIILVNILEIVGKLDPCLAMRVGLDDAVVEVLGLRAFARIVEKVAIFGVARIVDAKRFGPARSETAVRVDGEASEPARLSIDSVAADIRQVPPDHSLSPDQAVARLAQNTDALIAEHLAVNPESRAVIGINPAVDADADRAESLEDTAVGGTGRRVRRAPHAPALGAERGKSSPDCETDRRRGLSQQASTRGARAREDATVSVARRRRGFTIDAGPGDARVLTVDTVCGRRGALGNAFDSARTVQVGGVGPLYDRVGVGSA